MIKFNDCPNTCCVKIKIYFLIKLLEDIILDLYTIQNKRKLLNFLMYEYNYNNMMDLNLIMLIYLIYIVIIKQTLI